MTAVDPGATAGASESDITVVEDGVPVEPAGPAQDRKTVRKEQRKQLLRDPSFVIGAAIVLFWVLCALIPDLFTSRDPQVGVSVEGRGFLARTSPDGDAWFGTDNSGKDVYARVIHGARSVLTTAPVAAGLAVAAGAVLGLLMGYFRGWVDEVISRVSEAFLSLPVVLLAIMVLVVFGASNLVIVLTVAGLFTPVVARTVRSAVLTESQLDYVVSAELRGEPSWFVMFREILPNITNILVVEFTVRVAYAIFTIATLAFLGFAGDPLRADWGNDIANSYTLIPSGQWWITIFPSIAIATLVIGVNLIADSLDKALKS